MYIVGGKEERGSRSRLRDVVGVADTQAPHSHNLLPTARLGTSSR